MPRFQLCCVNRLRSSEHRPVLLNQYGLSISLLNEQNFKVLRSRYLAWRQELILDLSAGDSGCSLSTNRRYARGQEATARYQRCALHVD